MEFVTAELSPEDLLHRSVTVGQYPLWYHNRLKAKSWDGRTEGIKYVQMKYDGHRITAFRQADGKIAVFGRKMVGTDGRLINLSPQLREHNFYSQLLRLPPYTSLDCEMYIPNAPASSVKTALKENVSSLRITPFAMPVFNSQDFTKVCLFDIEAALNALGIPFATTLTYWDESKETLILSAANMKMEGVVLKEGHYSGWWKIKMNRTVDCIVTGLKDGDGKYLGEVGALLVSVIGPSGLIEIASVSGMTDAVRSEISEKDIGRVVEIEYQEVASQGRLRHPRFVAWRDDKKPEECTADQLEEA